VQLLVDEVADVAAGVDVEFDEEVEVSGGGIDLRRDLRVDDRSRHAIRCAEFALDEDEEGVMRSSR
jgi:hypothetical protein